MSFEEYLKIYGTEYIEAVAFKFYKYYFCNNKICDYEDFVQHCLMKLFEQWGTWDSNKCQANTFIYMKIKGYGYTLVRDGNAQKRSGLTNEFSLDYEIDNGANKNSTLYDLVNNTYKIYMQLLQCILYHIFLNILQNSYYHPLKYSYYL